MIRKPELNSPRMFYARCTNRYECHKNAVRQQYEFTTNAMRISANQYECSRNAVRTSTNAVRTTANHCKPYLTIFQIVDRCTLIICCPCTVTHHVVGLNNYRINSLQPYTNILNHFCLSPKWI